MFTVMFINILSLPSMSKSSNFAAVIAGWRARAAHAHCRNIYFTTFSYQLQTFKSKEYIQNCAFLTIWFIIGGHYEVIGMVHRPLTMPHEKSSEVPQFVFKSQISFKLWSRTFRPCKPSSIRWLKWNLKVLFMGR